MTSNVHAHLLHKMQRALRNRKGCQLTNKEVDAILHSDAWMLIAKAEMEELRRASPLPGDSVSDV